MVGMCVCVCVCVWKHSWCGPGVGRKLLQGLWAQSLVEEILPAPGAGLGRCSWRWCPGFGMCCLRGYTETTQWEGCFQKPCISQQQSRKDVLLWCTACLVFLRAEPRLVWLHLGAGRRWAGRLWAAVPIEEQSLNTGPSSPLALETTHEQCWGCRGADRSDSLLPTSSLQAHLSYGAASMKPGAAGPSISQRWAGLATCRPGQYLNHGSICHLKFTFLN